MFNFFSMKSKETPEETKLVENVQIQFTPNEEEDIADHYIIGENKGRAEYISTLQQTNLMNITQKNAFFFDLQGNIDSIPPEVVKVKVPKMFIKSTLDFTSKKIYDMAENIYDKLKSIFSTNLDFNNLELNLINQTSITVNSTGSIAAFLRNNKQVILINLMQNTNEKFHTLNFHSDDKENTVQELLFHSINPHLLSVIHANKIVNYNIKSRAVKSCLNFSGIVTARYSPDGNYLLIITNNGFSLLDNHSPIDNIIFSQSQIFPTKFIGCVWALNSSYFVIYSESHVLLYNRLNLEFKTWSEFTGKIKHVEMSEDSFKIFTDDSALPIYVIFNISNEKYCELNINKSYHNINQYYLHQEFRVSNKILSLAIEEFEIVKIKTNSFNQDNRLVILYRNKKNNRTLLNIYEQRHITSSDVKIRFLFSLKSFKNLSLVDFEIYSTNNKEEVLLLNWEDKLLSKTYLNFNC